jgi:hypothetical protein
MSRWFRSMTLQAAAVGRIVVPRRRSTSPLCYPARPVKLASTVELCDHRQPLCTCGEVTPSVSAPNALCQRPKRNGNSVQCRSPRDDVRRWLRRNPGKV